MTDQNKGFQKRSFQELQAAMRGRWYECLSTLAPELVANYEHSGKRRRHYVCPVHGGQNSDAFRFFDDFNETGGGVCNSCGYKPNGVVMLTWYFEIPTKEATRMVGEWLDDRTVTNHTAPARVFEPVVDTTDYAARMRALKSTAARCLDIKGTPVELYLRKVRKLPEYAISPRIRYHPGVKYTCEINGGRAVKNFGYFPAWVIALRDRSTARNDVCTLHVGYLQQDGSKAEISLDGKKLPSKKSMLKAVPTISGAAVQLFEPEHGILAVSEGFETASSVRAGTYLPTWATLTAGALETMHMVEGVELYIVFADKDKSERGFIAACRFAQRVLEAGKKVLVYYPEDAIPEGQKGIDWSDTWKNCGSAGFPEPLRYNRKTEECKWREMLAEGKNPIDILCTPENQDPKLFDCTEAVERQRARAQAARLARKSANEASASAQAPHEADEDAEEAATSA